MEQLKSVWAQGLLCFARVILVKERRKVSVSLWYHSVISHQRKVSGARSGTGCMLLSGHPLLTDKTLKGKFSWQKTQGREQEENLKDESLCSYTTAKIILWGWISSKPSQSHPLSGSLTQAGGWQGTGWGTCSRFHGGLQAAGLEGYRLLYPFFIALFFVGVSNHIRARWVFKWCIKDYHDWSLTSTEICWTAFVPIRVVVLGESRPPALPVLQLCGSNLWS